MSTAGRSKAFRRFLPRPQAVLLALLLAVLAAGVSEAAAAGPTSKAKPTVAGEPTQGKRLLGGMGSWSGSGKFAYTYQWFRCDQMGADCALLRGATKRSYALGANDVGHTIGLMVHAKDSGGTTTAVSSLIGPIAGTPPLLVSTRQPTVSGQVVQGSVLKVTPGTWSPVPESFSYQWVRCNKAGRACAPIAGAKAETYAVAAGDLGHALLAIVQAHAGATSRAVFSTAATGRVAAPVAAPDPVTGPLSSAPPLVAVVIQQGRQLTGAVGSWSGSGTIKYAYRWYRCNTAGARCKSIRGATRPTYTLAAKDVGQTIGFGVRATDSTGTTNAYASLVGPVAGPKARLVSTRQPTVTGLPKEGQALEVSAGSWSRTPETIAYQWQRCNRNGRLCKPLPGATASTYAVTAADTGHALRAVVHARLGAASQEAVSVATPAVVSAQKTGPSSHAPPIAAGTSQRGRQLTGSTGHWSGSGTISYGYQWYRCDPAGMHCSSVHGATRPTYTLVAKDVGFTLGLAVRATDATGTATAYASLIGPIAAAGVTLVSTAQPAIAGLARQGQTLQVSDGTWSGKPASVTYMWQRCNPNGRLCSPIAGATGATYAVGAADAGHTLLALVEAKAKNVTQATLSVATDVVV